MKLVILFLGLLTCSLSFARERQFVTGLGSVVLPPGEWKNDTPATVSESISGRRCFVFTKMGERLERIIFIRYSKAKSPAKVSHILDTLGESLWRGMPQEYKAHESLNLLISHLKREPKNDSAERYVLSSILEDQATKEVWLQHGVAFKVDGVVMAIIHMSAQAISPNVVMDLLDDTEWQSE